MSSCVWIWATDNRVAAACRLECRLLPGIVRALLVGRRSPGRTVGSQQVRQQRGVVRARVPVSERVGSAAIASLSRASALRVFASSSFARRIHGHAGEAEDPRAAETWPGATRCLRMRRSREGEVRQRSVLPVACRAPARPNGGQCRHLAPAAIQAFHPPNEDPFGSVPRTWLASQTARAHLHPLATLAIQLAGDSRERLLTIGRGQPCKSGLEPSSGPRVPDIRHLGIGNLTVWSCIARAVDSQQRHHGQPHNEKWDQVVSRRPRARRRLTFGRARAEHTDDWCRHARIKRRQALCLRARLRTRWRQL